MAGAWDFFHKTVIVVCGFAFACYVAPKAVVLPPFLWRGHVPALSSSVEPMFTDLPVSPMAFSCSLAQNGLRDGLRNVMWGLLGIGVALVLSAHGPSLWRKLRGKPTTASGPTAAASPQAGSQGEPTTAPEPTAAASPQARSQVEQSETSGPGTTAAAASPNARPQASLQASSGQYAASTSPTGRSQPLRTVSAMAGPVRTTGLVFRMHQHPAMRQVARRVGAANPRQRCPAHKCLPVG